MKFDTAVLAPKLGEMAAFTEAAEAIGFDGLWVGETASNPFLPLALAAEHSNRIKRHRLCLDRRDGTRGRNHPQMP